MTLATDIQSLSPGAVIDLFQIDLSQLGGGVFKFYPGVDENYGDVVFGGETYTPFPVKVSGLGKGGQGPLPRPTLLVSNVSGFMSSMLPLYGDMVGARVTRYRTLGKYLATGSTPDFNAKTTEIYFIDRKKVETAEVIEFELASAIDVMNKKIPGRQMIANTCVWQYRSDECSWTGTDYYDRDDNPVANQADDTCGKRLSSCQARFGTDVGLPFGGFPALGKY